MSENEVGGGKPSPPPVPEGLTVFGSIAGPHKCNNSCSPPLSLNEEESVKHNPRAIPLLLKWKRLYFFKFHNELYTYNSA